VSEVCGNRAGLASGTTGRRHERETAIEFTPRGPTLFAGA